MAMFLPCEMGLKIQCRNNTKISNEKFILAISQKCWRRDLRFVPLTKDICLFRRRSEPVIRCTKPVPAFAQSERSILCSPKRRAIRIRIIAESVRHDVWPDSISTRIHAEVGASTIVNQTFINLVRADSTVKLEVVCDAIIDNLLE